MASTPYKASLLKKRNLDDLINLFYEEQRDYNKLINCGITFSKEIISNKKDMGNILEEIKVPFYDLTKLEPIKDPKIFVKPQSVYGTFAKILATDKINMGLLTAMSGIIGAFPLFLGAGIASSVLLSGVTGITLFNTNCAINYLKEKEIMAQTVAFHTGNNKIFIPKAYKEYSRYIIAHEFIHDINIKHGLKHEDNFINEGVTTATAFKVMDLLGKLGPSNRLFSLERKIINLIASLSLIIGKDNLVMDSFLSDSVNDALEREQYTLGSAIVQLAEKK